MIPGMFYDRLRAMSSPSVLEMGTLRWEESRPTHHKDEVPNAGMYVMTDVAPGTDVDIVSDAHTMSKDLAGMKFDAIISVSVWEHLKRPWVAANELAECLKPGGFAMVMTHQTFPVHGYPDDYFRFSDMAMNVLFEDAGLVTIESGYEYPCKIVPPKEVTRWNTAAPSFLNVVWYGEKPSS